MAGGDFHGAKIAVLARGQVLTLLRDDRPGLLWAGMWDLPGGAREGAETPEACVLRELHEELTLALDPRWLVWRRVYDATPPGVGRAWFLVAEASGADLSGIALGDEGREWRWMGLSEYLGHDGAVPHHRARLADYLRDRASREAFANV